MNIEKFTQKSLEAIQKATEITKQEQNPEMGQEHLLIALMTEENSLIRELMVKMNVGNNFT